MKFSIALILTTALFAPLASAQEGQEIRGKTIIASFYLFTQPVSFKYFISNEGKVFSYSNDTGQCDRTGQMTTLNGGAQQTSYRCGEIAVKGTAQASYSNGLFSHNSKTAFNGSKQMVYRATVKVEGNKCSALNYSADGKSFRPISCDIVDGNAAQ